MKSKLISTFFILLTLTLIGCDSTDNNNDASGDIITSDITVAPAFLDLENQQYNDTWDIKLSSDNHSYIVGTNSSAGVLVVNSGSMDFANAALPDSGLEYENAAEPVIGDNWWDTSTYSIADHSIQGDKSVYFIRTVSYEWIKFEIISGSPSQFEIKYAFLTYNEDGDLILGETETSTINYSSDAPAYFDFTTSTTTSESDWNIGFSMIPDYSPELSTYMFMPTILINMNSSVKITILENTNYADVIDIPTSGWLEDTYDNRSLSYNSEHMVLWYHPEPPYNHKVVVENPELIYLFDTGNFIYKFMFNEYNSGILSFKYEKI